MELQREKTRTLQQELQDTNQLTKTASKQGVVCPRCGTTNDAESSFCENCGAPLARAHCPGCGSPMEPGSDYCENCGIYQIYDSTTKSYKTITQEQTVVHNHKAVVDEGGNTLATQEYYYCDICKKYYDLNGNEVTLADIKKAIEASKTPSAT